MNNKPVNNDPAELLAEYYEAIEMDDAYRRDIQARTRDAVTRRRVTKTRWIFNLAGVAAAVAVLFLILQFGFRPASGPKSAYTGSISSNSSTTPEHGPVQDVKQLDKTARKPDNKQPANRPDMHREPTRQPLRPHLAANMPVPPRHESVKEAANPRLSPVPPAKRGATPIVVLVSVQGYVTDELNTALKAGDRLPARAEVRIGANAEATLVTRKGSELHLDSNSRLLLASDKVASLSRGRLYCSNRNKEIARIETPAGQVRLLGTVVDTAVVKKNAVAVTVVEGKVQLSNKHGKALVDAGKRSVLMAFLPPRPGVKVDTYRETAWYHGRGDYQSDFGDIAYAVRYEGRGELTEIWVSNPDGSGKHRLRSFLGSALEVGPWLPGEKWLNINLSTILWTAPNKEKRLASAGGGHPIIPRQIVLVNAVSGQTTPFDLPQGYDPLYASFAPDPTRMAFCGYYQPNPDSWGNAEDGVWMYDKRTGKVTKLLSGAIKTSAAWAPDNRHVAVSTGEGYVAGHHLVIVDVDTGKVRDLGVQGAGASFSPDGKKIAYCGGFRNGGGFYHGVPMDGSIYVLDLTPGARPIRVSPEGQNALEPRWSPDGSRIVFLAEDRACVVRADGTDLKDIYRIDTGMIGKASWASSGDAVYVSALGKDWKTLLVAADGSGVLKELYVSSQSGKLSPDAKAQTDAALADVQEAVFEYAMGKIHTFEGDLKARRDSYARSAHLFGSLVWKYPLSGLGIDDIFKYADNSAREAARSDADALHDSCEERIRYLGIRLVDSTVKHHQFAPDLATLIDWSVGSRWGINWLFGTDEAHVKMMAACPGTPGHSAISYIYTPPANGKDPGIGDVLIRCPLHPDICYKWDEDSLMHINNTLMDQTEPGGYYQIRRTPYILLNTGSGPLTVTYNGLTDKYEAKGQVTLLPIGKVYTDEQFSIGLLDEESIAKAIDSAAKLDWGGLPRDQVEHAEEELSFCRGVAQFKAGQPVTACDTIDGEPARLLFSTDGSMKGSWGAINTSLRFEYVGPGPVRMYQLIPSGRFKATGAVRCIQTKDLCTDGWFDKNGKVISTAN